MITEVINIESCCGCGSCFSACPVDCIQMEQGADGFLYPVVSSEKCIGCNKCHAVCPVIETQKTASGCEKAFAAFCQNELIRENSSSGGLFYWLAERIISEGGIVFGASAEDIYNVEHVAVRKVDEIKKIQGSKYVQSNILRCFVEAREALQKGKWVLFSGTACQISGLRSFLGRDYEKLITVDLICHGVISPIIWRRHITDIEQQKGARVVSVNFRNKRHGWRSYSMAVKFDDDTEMISKRTENTFYRIYDTNLGMRSSCYDCQFKGIKRVSDITLGDFWGIERVAPELDDGRGCSSVITHSEKGEWLIHEISDKLCIREVAIEHIVSNNPSIICSSQIPAKREAFWRDIECGISLDKLARKYDDVSLILKMKRKIKSIIG